MIALKTSLHAYLEADGRYWCLKCLRTRDDVDRKALFCTEVLEEPVLTIQFEKGFEVSFRSCPGNVAARWIPDYIAVYLAYKKGKFPYSGGYLDQPNKIIEVFEIIGHHLNILEEKEQAKVESKRRLEQLRVR